MHLIVGLLSTGARVASIDTDGRQCSLTRYVENRAVWAKRNGLDLKLPSHFRVPPAEGESVSEIEDREFRAFAQAVSRTEYGYDYVVIDTAGSNSYLMRVSHAMADTLVTPINDSFVDFDVIGRVEQDSYAVVGPSHYADLVREAFRQRELVDDRRSDWVVVRNRLSPLRSRNQQHLIRGLRQLSDTLGYRTADGITERLIFREYFPRGLTALDDHPDGSEPSASHLAARREVRSLMATLRLPLDAPPPGERPPPGDQPTRGPVLAASGSADLHSAG